MLGGRPGIGSKQIERIFRGQGGKTRVGFGADCYPALRDPLTSF